MANRTNLRRLATVAAGTVVLSLAFSGDPEGSAPQDGALTPGRLSLLAATPDENLMAALRVALEHEADAMRAVAARITGVSRLRLLEPEISVALARETNEKVAAELIRALLFIATPGAERTTDAYAAKAGVPGVRIMAASAARRPAEEFLQRLPDLAQGFGVNALNEMGPLIFAAARRAPAARPRLLQAALNMAHGEDWGRFLERLKLSEDSSPDWAVALDALRSPKEGVREATVWRTVSLAAHHQLPAVLFNQVLADDNGDPSVTWERFGRELIQRLGGRTTPDRAALVAREVRRWRDQHESQRIDKALLTEAETAAVRKALGNEADEVLLPELVRIEDEQLGPDAVTLRTVVSPWPGFLRDLLSASQCGPMRDPLFGGVTLTYRPDGRPATAVLEQGELPDRCLDALRALVSVTLDDDRHPATAEVPQLVVLSIGQEWVQCADTPASRRLVNRDELVEQPRKLVDVRPHYPDDARAERIQGVVSFEMVISAEGCVPTITVQRGIHPSISFAALAAVTRWRYTPARLAGEPVDHVLSYVIDFRLR